MQEEAGLKGAFLQEITKFIFCRQDG